MSRLPPEFSRAERFDGVFFLDLPGAEERQAIWRMYLQQFELDENQRLPDDANWTGAEIRASCRLAALLDLPLAQAATIAYLASQPSPHAPLARAARAPS